MTTAIAYVRADAVFSAKHAATMQIGAPFWMKGKCYSYELKSYQDYRRRRKNWDALVSLLILYLTLKCLKVRFLFFEYYEFLFRKQNSYAS